MNGVIPDGTSAVLNENMFNDPPAPGHQFFLADVTATYAGNEEPAHLWDLTFNALGPSSVAYDYSASCGVVPNEIDELRDVFRGGSIRGHFCWEVSAADAGALVMYGKMLFDDSSLWWSLIP